MSTCIGWIVDMDIPMIMCCAPLLGRGVFTSSLIPPHTLLETCPVLILPRSQDEAHIRHTELYHYT